MSRVRMFFLREAAECLEALGNALDDGLQVEPAYSAVRRFRGSAHMARFGELAREAAELETRLRRVLDGTAGPPPVNEVRAVAAALGGAVEAVREGRLVEDPKLEEEMEEQGTGGADETLAVVAIDTLEYRGQAALEQALALREPLENAIVANEGAGPILEELFDLIRLGAK